MISVDTNILARLLVNDPAEQKQIDIVKTLLQQTKQVYVTQIVQIELVWVLETAYHFNKENILFCLKHLAGHPFFILQHPILFTKAIDDYQNNNVDFSDCLILAENREQNCELAAFDRKLGRLNGVRWLST
jgi:predicted nucleic-acid-binding protein